MYTKSKIKINQNEMSNYYIIILINFSNDVFIYNLIKSYIYLRYNNNIIIIYKKSFIFKNIIMKNYFKSIFTFILIINLSICKLFIYMLFIYNFNCLE